MDNGQAATLAFTVEEQDTAAALGSGDLAVLATPRLLAWCEAATCAAIAGSVSEKQTSVGTRVQLDHLAASPVGESVSVTATVAYVDGRLVRFEVVASHPGDGKVVGHGEVTRVVVDRERFLSRVGRA
ncbi:MAG: thioesterase family protein [Actinomycetes bacterium]